MPHVHSNGNSENGNSNGNGNGSGMCDMNGSNLFGLEKGRCGRCNLEVFEAEKLVAAGRVSVT